MVQMKFSKYLKRIREMNLPIGKYAIFGSGPIAIRNLRDSRDIDLIVTKDIFKEYLNKSGWKVIKFKRDSRHVEMLEKEDIELYSKWGPGNWDTMKLIEGAEIIKGLPFVNVKDFIRWKKISGREKDMKDVELIRRYLKINSKRI
jgi:hypothetical protein